MSLERLERFLAALQMLPAELRPGRQPHTIEFREPSWYDDRVFELLERNQVALCLHDMKGSATGKMLVGPFIYARFHVGTSKYGGKYPDRRLDDWADWLGEQSRRGLDMFAYFNNDEGGHAPRDAVRLRDRLIRRQPAYRLL